MDKNQNPIQSQNLQSKTLMSPMTSVNSPKKDEFHNVWTAEKVAECEKMMEEYGECPGGNPFHFSDPNYRAADIVYEYSEEELIEIAKCAQDAVYFANNYCSAMTDEGIRKITLRPYQEKVLRSFQENRFNVFLASRQIGKCTSYSSLISYKKNSVIKTVPVYVLFYALIKRVRRLTLIEKIKIILYNLQSELTRGKIYKIEI